ncbi:MAG: immunity 21 family protein [Lentisphaeria bacterium]|nr:immunity 21 family protein [Lentisphaeria bacterium]
MNWKWFIGLLGGLSILGISVLLGGGYFLYKIGIEASGEVLYELAGEAKRDLEYAQTLNQPTTLEIAQDNYDGLLAEIEEWKTLAPENSDFNYYESLFNQEYKKRDKEIASGVNPFEAYVSAIEGMDQFKYLVNDGGPFILIPSSMIKQWKGEDNHSSSLIDDKTHYNLACDKTVHDWLAIMELDHKNILLIKDPAMLTYSVNEDVIDLIFLEEWSEVNLDKLTQLAIDQMTVSKGAELELIIEFSEEHQVLMSSADCAPNYLYDTADLKVIPGKYSVKKFEYRNEPQFEYVFILRLERLKD